MDSEEAVVSSDALQAAQMIVMAAGRSPAQLQAAYDDAISAGIPAEDLVHSLARMMVDSCAQHSVVQAKYEASRDGRTAALSQVVVRRPLRALKSGESITIGQAMDVWKLRDVWDWSKARHDKDFVADAYIDICAATKQFQRAGLSLFLSALKTWDEAPVRADGQATKRHLKREAKLVRRLREIETAIYFARDELARLMLEKL